MEQDVYKTPTTELLEEKAPVSYPMASTGQRFLNMIFDFIFYLIFSLLVGILLGLTGNASLLEGINENLFGVVVLIIYYFPQEAIWGRTLGKLITKTKVVGLKGEKVSAGKAFGRTLCRMIPFETFTFLGGNGRPHGIHDRLPKTKVVSLRKA